MDGYAVAFPVDPGCQVVDFAFAGNKPVLWSAIISGVASLALLVFALVALSRRRAVRPTRTAPLLPDPPTVRVALRWALAWGVAAALAGGFVFALRAGVVIGPLVAFVLWRGIDAKRLALAAGALLGVVVPILYLVVPIRDRGGYSTSAPMDRIAAHWVAVARDRPAGAGALPGAGRREGRAGPQAEHEHAARGQAPERPSTIAAYCTTP